MGLDRLEHFEFRRGLWHHQPTDDSQNKETHPGACSIAPGATATVEGTHPKRTESPKRIRYLKRENEHEEPKWKTQLVQPFSKKSRQRVHNSVQYDADNQNTTDSRSAPRKRVSAHFILKPNAAAQVRAFRASPAAAWAAQSLKHTDDIEEGKHKTNTRQQKQRVEHHEPICGHCG